MMASFVYSAENAALYRALSPAIPIRRLRTMQDVYQFVSLECNMFWVSLFPGARAKIDASKASPRVSRYAFDCRFIVDALCRHDSAISTLHPSRLARIVSLIVDAKSRGTSAIQEDWDDAVPPTLRLHSALSDILVSVTRPTIDAFPEPHQDLDLVGAALHVVRCLSRTVYNPALSHAVTVAMFSLVSSLHRVIGVARFQREAEAEHRWVTAGSRGFSTDSKRRFVSSRDTPPSTIAIVQDPGVLLNVVARPTSAQSPDYTFSAHTVTTAEAPVEALAGAPVDITAEAPSEAPVDTTAEAQAEAPVDTSVEALADALADAPVDTTAEASVEAPADAPVDTAVEALDDAPVEAPADAPVEAPAVGVPIDIPVCDSSLATRKRSVLRVRGVPLRLPTLHPASSPPPCADDSSDLVSPPTSPVSRQDDTAEAGGDDETASRKRTRPIDTSDTRCDSQIEMPKRARPVYHVEHDVACLKASMCVSGFSVAAPDVPRCGIDQFPTAFTDIGMMSAFEQWFEKSPGGISLTLDRMVMFDAFTFEDVSRAEFSSESARQLRAKAVHLVGTPCIVELPKMLFTRVEQVGVVVSARLDAPLLIVCIPVGVPEGCIPPFFGCYTKTCDGGSGKHVTWINVVVPDSRVQFVPLEETLCHRAWTRGVGYSFNPANSVTVEQVLMTQRVRPERRSRSVRVGFVEALSCQHPSDPEVVFNMVEDVAGRTRLHRASQQFVCTADGHADVRPIAISCGRLRGQRITQVVLSGGEYAFKPSLSAPVFHEAPTADDYDRVRTRRLQDWENYTRFGKEVFFRTHVRPFIRKSNEQAQLKAKLLSPLFSKGRETRAFVERCEVSS